MKITSVECYLGTGAIGGFVTMKINTDSGIMAGVKQVWLMANLQKPLLVSARTLAS